jgi:hypothetical protein
MSGGSYNYLCHKEANELENHLDDVESMRDRLIELGHLDIAQETESLILTIKAFKVRINARLSRLQDVWKEVEWYDSGDSGKDSVNEAVDKYREL